MVALNKPRHGDSFVWCPISAAPLGAARGGGWGHGGAPFSCPVKPAAPPALAPNRVPSRPRVLLRDTPLRGAGGDAAPRAVRPSPCAPAKGDAAPLPPLPHPGGGAFGGAPRWGIRGSRGLWWGEGRDGALRGGDTGDTPPLPVRWPVPAHGTARLRAARGLPNLLHSGVLPPVGGGWWQRGAAWGHCCH